MQNILIIALLGAALLAYSVTTTVYAYRNVRYPKPHVIVMLFLGDILLAASAAAAIVKYLVA